jgi:hypothetical protein
MIESAFFFNELRRRGVGFFAGVPDSLLKSFCAYISDNTGGHHHITAVNEGAALSFQAGRCFWTVFFVSPYYRGKRGGGAFPCRRLPPCDRRRSGGLYAELRSGERRQSLLSLCDAAVY